MSTYDYRNANDLVRLSDDLAGASTAQRAEITSDVLAAGLMRTPWQLRLGRAIALILAYVLRRPVAWLTRGRYFVLILSNSTAVDLVQELWAQTLHWMRHGLDVTDSRSAGGWSEMELAHFLEICRRAGITKLGEPA